MAGFVKNSKYYTGTVYEWNLPTGSTCPLAKECRVSVDRFTGKFSISEGRFKCYASSAERFPGVRKHRWENYEASKLGKIPTLPKDCKSIRVHASGDFFSQEYFDLWLEIAIENPCVEIWAYTKSLLFWIKRLNQIPKNFILTASRGGGPTV